MPERPTPPEAMEAASKMEAGEETPEEATERRKKKSEEVAKALWEKGLGEKLGFDSLEKFQERFVTIEIGGSEKDDLVYDLESAGIEVLEYGRVVQDDETFTTLPEPREITLIRVAVSELDHDDRALTTTEILKHVEDLGLSGCPAEVGPHLAIANAKQKKSIYNFYGMEQGDEPKTFLVLFDGRRGVFNRLPFNPKTKMTPEVQVFFVAPEIGAEK